MKFHITITSIFLGIIALIIVPMIVLGQTTHNVQGYAWANMPNPNDEKKTTNCHPSDTQYDADNVGCGQGLGWITLDGVSLNSDTGVFAGSGNSQFGGAVNFAPTTTNAPEAPLLNARVDASCLKTKNPCAITGWIKFTQAADGWDGWVKMSGQTVNGGRYGVQLDAPDNNGLRTFSGYAWGDHVAGWIDFKYASVKVEPPKPKRKLYYCGNPLATPPTGANYQTPEQVAERVARANAQNDGYTYTAERDDSTCLICPEGTSFDRDRDQCVRDVCPNIDGIQTSVPAGYSVINGQCVKDGDPNWCANIPGWTTQSLPTAGQPNVKWNKVGQNCIPTACKITGRGNYYAPRTVTVLNTPLSVIADNRLCEEEYICENTTPPRRSLPGNSGSGATMITWSITGKTCIPRSCEPNGRTELGVLVQQRPESECGSGPLFPGAPIET